MNTKKRYSPEVRERAVRMLCEHKGEYGSEWAALTSISSKIGCTAETLRKWVRRTETDQGKRPGMTTSELEEVKALKRENFELKRANEILRKASAFFAQAELDRPLEVHGGTRVSESANTMFAVCRRSQSRQRGRVDL